MGSDLLAQAIDRAVLAPVVGRLLGSERAEIVDWTCETLLGGFITSVRGGGVYRFSGTARIDEVMTPWSVVLKVKVANSLDAAPTDPYYWKRDCLAYQSGLLNDLSGDLVVPRCFGTVERSDDEVWIWLEEVADVHGGEWPASRYGLAARHLGQFSGSYLGGRPLPTYPWLSQQRQRRWVNRNHDKLARYSGVEDHPLVRRSWPGDHAARVLRLWSERELFLDTSDRLPQVFCHLDFFRRNLFARRGGDGREETIVIDWEFAGVGAIGQDASQMAPLSYLFHEYDGSARVSRRASLRGVYGGPPRQWLGRRPTAREAGVRDCRGSSQPLPGRGGRSDQSRLAAAGRGAVRVPDRAGSGPLG